MTNEPLTTHHQIMQRNRDSGVSRFYSEDRVEAREIKLHGTPVVAEHESATYVVHSELVGGIRQYTVVRARWNGVCEAVQLHELSPAEEEHITGAKTSQTAAWFPGAQRASKVASRIGTPDEEEPGV